MNGRLLPNMKGTGSLCPLSTSMTVFRSGVVTVDEDLISGGGSEPSWCDSNASLKLPLSTSASASETPRPICKMSGS